MLLFRASMQEWRSYRESILRVTVVGH